VRTTDVPDDSGCSRTVLKLSLLIARAANHKRGSWLALSDAVAWRKSLPGIYIVRWAEPSPPVFLPTPGKAIHARPETTDHLARKWEAIVSRASTDVVYVGKGDCLRERIRLLALFGVGRRDNHVGGEWMWQIEGITAAEIVLITCTQGRQVGFENAFLERFESVHGDYPLANRKGPEGLDRWWPSAQS
jgi:hypothetical protein